MRVDRMGAIILLPFIAMGCHQEELSRRNAEDLLTAALREARVGHTARIPASIEIQASDESCAELLERQASTREIPWSSLQRVGRIRIDKHSWQGRTSCDVGLVGGTDDVVAAENSLWTLRVTQRQVDAITGVSAPATDAAGLRVSYVHYTYAEVLTPTGKDLVEAGMIESADFPEGAATAVAVLYDDGWRFEDLQ